MPTKVIITVLIILGIGVGTGGLVFGILEAAGAAPTDVSGVIAGGAGVLATSLAALVAHLAGGFRDLDDRDS